MMSLEFINRHRKYLSYWKLKSSEVDCMSTFVIRQLLSIVFRKLYHIIKTILFSVTNDTFFLYEYTKKIKNFRKLKNKKSCMSHHLVLNWKLKVIYDDPPEVPKIMFATLGANYSKTVHFLRNIK